MTWVSIGSGNYFFDRQLFIHENAFENVVCEMAVILSRGEMSQNFLLLVGSYYHIDNALWFWGNLLRAVVSLEESLM